MKKILLGISILVLSFALLVGCGSDDEDSLAEVIEEGLEATISVQAESDWVEYYEAARDRVLEEHPNSTINIIEVDSLEHLEVLTQTDPTNVDVADVFAIPADRLYGLNQNNVLAPINALEMAERVGGFDDYDSGLGGNLKIDDDYLAFPMNIETLINFANKSNAEAADINIYDTIEFTEVDHNNILIPVWNAWFGIALTNTANIELLGMDDNGDFYSDLTKDFDELDEDMQGVFEGLFSYWQFHYAEGTDLWDSEAAWGYMDTEFQAGGNSVVRLDGPWATGNLSNIASDGEDLEILPINQVELNGKPFAHWKGGWGLAVNARIEEDEQSMALAQLMIEEIQNTDYAIEFFEASGKIMENVDIDVYLTSDLSQTNIDVIEAVIYSYEDAPARPLFSEWDQVWNTWETGILSWSSVNPSTVEEAYFEVQASFKAMMQNLD